MNIYDKTFSSSSPVSRGKLRAGTKSNHSDTVAGFSLQSRRHFAWQTSARVLNFTALLPHSHDHSFYVSRPVLAPPLLLLQEHADLRAHDFAHFPELWHQPRLADITCVSSWILCGITPAIVPRKFRDLFCEHQRKVTTSEAVVQYEGVSRNSRDSDDSEIHDSK
jgi:hypothetical protein